MKVIDSHTHIGEKTDLVALWRDMEQTGIGRIIFSNLGEFKPYPTSEEIHHFNQVAWELVQSAPDKLSFLTYLNPQLPDWRTELDTHQSHAVGVKLWIALKDPTTGSLDRTLEVLQECEKRGLPVLIHVFNRTYQNLPGEIDIHELETLAHAVPHCTIVAAHSGACNHDSSSLFRRTPPNVCWDLSGSFPAHQLLKNLLKELPAERILYGSDGTGRTFASQLLKVTALPELSAEERDAILFKNAARIYHLPEPPELAWTFPRPEGDFRCDLHCYCGRDPFGVAPEYSPEMLAEFMADHGVKHAFCTNLNSLLNWDPARENEKFVTACAPYEALWPLWSVNVQAHNFELNAYLADSFKVGGLWASPYWSATAPDDSRFLKLGRIAEQLNLPLFVHLGGPAEDRFRFPGVAPRTATAAEIERMLEALPHTEIYLQGAPDPLKLSSGNHQVVDFFPLDNTAVPAGQKQHVWGSGFPLRSFPVFPEK